MWYSEFSMGTDPARQQLSELRLCRGSRERFFRVMLEALGFEASGRRTLTGSSGLDHGFEAAGVRERNLLVVVASGDSLRRRLASDERTPRQRLEAWLRESLLSAYDVGAAFEGQGISVDLLLVHDAFTSIPPDVDLVAWAEAHDLRDGKWSEHRLLRPGDALPPHALADAATLIGSPYFSYDSLTLSELAGISTPGGADPVSLARRVLGRIRLTQYFDPPTDELILTALALAPSPNALTAIRVAEVSRRLGHRLAPNTIVKDADHEDPAATAASLRARRFIEYTDQVEVLDAGHKAVSTIIGTPQASWAVRVLRELDRPGIASALLDQLGHGLFAPPPGDSDDD
jgi:hypothetical protein